MLKIQIGKKCLAALTAFVLCLTTLFCVPLLMKESSLRAAAISTNAENEILQEYADEVVALVNQERANDGLDPLYAVPVLNEAAAVRAEECVEYYAHQRPDGSSCFTVLTEHEIRYFSAGENIAYGYKTPEAVVAAWMDSPGHRANILDEDYDCIGIGVSYDSSSRRYYWTQIFVDSWTTFEDKYLPTVPEITAQHTKEVIDVSESVTRDVIPEISEASLAGYDYYTFLFEPGEAIAMTLSYTVDGTRVSGELTIDSLIDNALFAHVTALSEAGEDSLFYTFHDDSVVTVRFYVPESVTISDIHYTLYYDADWVEPVETTEEEHSYTIIVDMPYVGELYVGDTFQMECETENYDGEVTWYSSNAHIAEITGDGVVTVTGEGEVTISLVDDNDIHYSITFTTYHVVTHTTTEVETTVATTELPTTTTETTTSTTTETEPAGLALGDVDGDGDITPTDAYLVLTAYAASQLGRDTGLTSAQVVAADTDGDGDITSSDATLILQYYATMQTTGKGLW